MLPPPKKNRTTLTGPSCSFFIQRGIRTGDPSVKKTCRWHVFRSESPRAGPRAGGESAGLPGERARKKIHNLKIFLSWRAKPNPSGRAKEAGVAFWQPLLLPFREIRTLRGSERKENVPVARFSLGEPASGAPRRRGVRGLTGRKGEEKDS